MSQPASKPVLRIWSDPESKQPAASAKAPLRIWFDSKSVSVAKSKVPESPEPPLPASRVESSPLAKPPRIPALVAHIVAEAVGDDDPAKDDPEVTFARAIAIAENCFDTKADDRFRNELVRHDGRWLRVHLQGESPGFSDLKRAVEGGLTPDQALASVSLPAGRLTANQKGELEEINGSNLGKARRAQAAAKLAEYCSTNRGQVLTRLSGIPEEIFVRHVAQVSTQIPALFDDGAASAIRVLESSVCINELRNLATRYGFDAAADLAALQLAMVVDSLDPFEIMRSPVRDVCVQRASTAWDTAWQEYGGAAAWAEGGGTAEDIPLLREGAIEIAADDFERSLGKISDRRLVNTLLEVIAFARRLDSASAAIAISSEVAP